MLLQPGVKFFEGCEGDVGNFEAAPVHVDGRRVAIDVGGAQGVYILPVLSISAEGSMLVVIGKEWEKDRRRHGRGGAYGTPS